MTDDQTERQRADDEPGEDEAATTEAGGPDTAELDQDPAYDPDDERLKDLKGG